MNPGLSTYLNAIRFLAALAVVLSHFTQQTITGGIVSYQGELAGVAVTVFFVLSGYVIAFVSDQKERSIRSFAVSRFARIYSVALPALLLTAAIDFYLYWFNAHVDIPHYEISGWWKYLPVFLTFTSEIGPIHVPVLSDRPFWSLSYEVWYYVAFAAVAYSRGWARVVLGVLAVAILGLPALLYLPIWIMGCAIYYLHKRPFVLPTTAATTIAFLSALLLVLLWAVGFYDSLDRDVNEALGGWPEAHLHNSAHFVTHYLSGLLFGIHLFAMKYVRLDWIARRQIAGIIRYAAGFTFALYLAHWPLMQFWNLVIKHDPHSDISIVALFVLTIGSAWLFGLVSERRKDAWHAFFEFVVDWLASRRANLARLS